MFIRPFLLRRGQTFFILFQPVLCGLDYLILSPVEIGKFGFFRQRTGITHNVDEILPQVIHATAGNSIQHMLCPGEILRVRSAGVNRAICWRFFLCRLRTMSICFYLN